MQNFLLIIVAVFSFSSSFAQEDSTAIKIDSVNLAALQEYKLKLSHIDKQRIEDSIKRKKLEAQIQSLRTTDNLKKENLEAQIKAINGKDSLRIANKKIRIDSLKITAKGYVVKGFFNDSLFIVYSRIGSFTAKERTKAINKRVQDLGNNVFFNENSLRIEESENMKNIVFGDDVVMSITETDAIWNNTSKTLLAEQYMKSINDAVIRYKSETDYTKLAKKAGLALLILIVIAIIIRYNFKLFGFIASKIRLQKDKKIKGIKVKNYMLVNANSQIKIFLWFNTAFKWLTTFLIIYFSLPFIFGLFPWTEHLAGTLFGYILAPLKRIVLAFWHYLPNLITIIITIIIFRYTLRAVKVLKNEIARGRLKINGFYTDWANPTYQIIRILLIAFAFIVIFPYLPGSDSPVFQAVSVFLGFLLTFGSSGSLSHIISGIVITYMRLYTIGDRVKIGEITGDVIEKSALVTRLRTSYNEIVSVPNSTVMSSHTINYSTLAKEDGLILTSTVNIGYDTPWVDVYAALMEAANRTDLLLKNPKPFALQHNLLDSFVAYEINAYTVQANSQATVYSRLHENIRDVFNEKGIEILSPNYNSIRDGNDSTISDKSSAKVEKDIKSDTHKKSEELLEKNENVLNSDKKEDPKNAIAQDDNSQESNSKKDSEELVTKKENVPSSDDKKNSQKPIVEDRDSKTDKKEEADELSTKVQKEPISDNNDESDEDIQKDDNVDKSDEGPDSKDPTALDEKNSTPDNNEEPELLAKVLKDPTPDDKKVSEENLTTDDETPHSENQNDSEERVANSDESTKLEIKKDSKETVAINDKALKSTKREKTEELLTKENDEQEVTDKDNAEESLDEDNETAKSDDEDSEDLLTKVVKKPKSDDQETVEKDDEASISDEEKNSEEPVAKDDEDPEPDNKKKKREDEISE